MGRLPYERRTHSIVLGWPYGEAQAYESDVERNFHATLKPAPEFAERVRAATRVAPFVGGAVSDSSAHRTDRAGH